MSYPGNCPRCKDGLLHEERIPFTQIWQTRCFACSDIVDPQVIHNRSNPELNPVTTPRLPGAPNHYHLIVMALDLIEEDRKAGFGYRAPIEDIARTVGVRRPFILKIQRDRRKRRLPSS